MPCKLAVTVVVVVFKKSPDDSYKFQAISYNSYFKSFSRNGTYLNSLLEKAYYTLRFIKI